MTTTLSLTDALKRHFGFDTFKGNQEQIMTNLMEGRDTFVLMPTGGGKSICYQVPALLADTGVAIVVSPLIALMQDQTQALVANGIPAAAIPGRSVTARMPITIQNTVPLIGTMQSARIPEPSK